MDTPAALAASEVFANSSPRSATAWRNVGVSLELDGNEHAHGVNPSPYSARHGACLTTRVRRRCRVRITLRRAQ